MRKISLLYSKSQKLLTYKTQGFYMRFSRGVKDNNNLATSMKRTKSHIYAIDKNLIAIL